MNNKQFATVVDQLLSSVEEMLVSKQDEYAEKTDVLHNFDIAANIQGQSMQEALGGMLAKHTVSIFDMIRANVNTFTPEQWDEKIVDHINYLILLKAIVIEEAAKDLKITNPNDPNQLSLIPDTLKDAQ